MGKKKSTFQCLVESEEGIRNFHSKYRIPSTVGMRYAAQGEWVVARQTGEVVIPMIAFTSWVVLLGVTLVSLGYPPPSLPQICLGSWEV